MDKIERLRNVIEKIKKINDLTNETLSTALGYKTKSYTSELLGGSKPITEIFLQRLEKTFKVNQAYILKGVGMDIIDSNIRLDARIENYGKSQEKINTIVDAMNSFDQKEPILPVKQNAIANPDPSLQSLIDSNKTFAKIQMNYSESQKNFSEAQKVFADSHKTVVDTNALLANMLNSKQSIDNSLKESSEVFDAKFPQLLGLLADLGVGKMWNSKPEGQAKLHKMFYGSVPTNEKVDSAAGAHKMRK